ncbi:hypothetical protein ES702_07226 [subsurface metagenome]
MEEKSYESMSVRVPLPIAKELKKLKQEQELPSIGSALQIYIENIKIERLESKFTALETAIEGINQVMLINQAATILNSSMITALMKAITPEKITDDPQAQKVIKDAIKRLENNQPMINSVAKIGMEQVKKYEQKHPQKNKRHKGIG